ncbi:MAG TPA: hypothetical protein VN025_04605 [Candidatus Dormibacteraeota bacterium]|jgi:hypothetical protein|nr:hypothetical protein [Candidatus Dormibacteraeota bacterium]
MNVLSAGEVTQWFQPFDELGSDYVHADKDGLFFTHPEAACIDLEYPAKLERLPFFAHCVPTIGYEDQHFNGALIWFHNWGVWNLFDEGIGYRIVEKMNAAAGQPKSFEVGLGHQFRADELPDAIGMLLQPMIFAWDSYYLPIWSYGTSEFFLHISHDSTVSIVARTKAFHDRVFQRLEELHLNPKAGNDRRTDRFCRRSTAKT